MNASEFAAEWIDAWNAHDLERILSHYDDEVVFTSPTAARVVPESGGVINGKDGLRRYWTLGLSMLPDLHFTLEAALETVDGVTIVYRNERGQLVAETMLFKPETTTVVRGVAAYA